jgi:hypothetical protein
MRAGAAQDWVESREGMVSAGIYISFFTAVAVYYDATFSIRVTPKLPMASNQPVKMSVQHFGCDSYPGNARAGKEFTRLIMP